MHTASWPTLPGVCGRFVAASPRDLLVDWFGWRDVVDLGGIAMARGTEMYLPLWVRLYGALKTPESNLETEASRRKPFPRTSTGRRAALAKWIADAKNPLTARVAVNHIWARHFGQPLVPTMFDFGHPDFATLHLPAVPAAGQATARAPAMGNAQR